MSTFQALKYLKHQVLAGHRHGHGIHSPFLFDFVSGIFRNKRGNDFVFTIEEIRRQLRSDDTRIKVTDLGSRSGQFDKKERRVSDIASRSSVPARYGILLQNMAAILGNGSIIEFGTSLGISSMYLASGSSGNILYTMEGCPECAGIARKNFTRANLGNIRIMAGSFESQLPYFSEHGIRPGLVFIDGNHRKKPVVEYFGRMLEIASPSTVIVVDDIHTTGEMEEAWNEIRNNPAVTATIDVFRMGIVFIKPGITSKHYRIRY